MAPDMVRLLLVAVEKTTKCYITFNQQTAQEIAAFPVVLNTGTRTVITQLNESNIKSGAKKLIILRVAGGPAGDISPSFVDSVYLAALSPEELVVNLGYSGTWLHSHFPKPDFSNAVSDVSGYCQVLRARNPKAKIILVGESLGGTIALLAMKRGCAGVADRLILVSPPLIKLSQAGENALEEMKEHAIADPLKPILVNDEKGQTKWVFERSANLFNKFFDKGQQELSLAQLLSNCCSRPLLIVYGMADVKIGLLPAREVAHAKNVVVLAVVGMKHTPDTKSLVLISRAVKQFVSG